MSNGFLFLKQPVGRKLAQLWEGLLALEPTEVEPQHSLSTRTQGRSFTRGLLVSASLVMVQTELTLTAC